jgi:alanyl-tRNA synthetase
VLSEAGIAAGVRRIEAVAGGGVMELLNSRDALVRSLTAKLKVKPEEVDERLDKLLEDAKVAQKQLDALKGELPAWVGRYDDDGNTLGWRYKQEGDLCILQ